MSKHVIIIGGGVIGRCAAYYLLKTGHKVTVLDRGGDACSGENAGMVVPSHVIPLAAPGVISKGLRWMFDGESPFCIRPRLSMDLISWLWKFSRAATPTRVREAVPVLRDLSLESRRLFVELSGEREFDFGLQQRGLLMLCRTEEMFDEEAEVAETANGCGVEARPLDRNAVQELDPGIEMDVCGGVYFPQDCHLSPSTFVENLGSAIEAMGGRLCNGVEVTEFALEGRLVKGVTDSEGERHEGDEYVLAGGAWSPEVVRDLEVALPMQAGKGYSMTVDNPVSLPEICSILCEAKVAVTPIGESLRFAGTMEIVGLDRSVSPRRVKGMVKSVPQYFPEFSTEDLGGREVWSGLRPCSPDGLPYIGRFRHYRNLTAATGHAMLGLSLGPVTGALISEIIAGDEPRVDSRLLSPDRYL